MTSREQLAGPRVATLLVLGNVLDQREGARTCLQTAVSIVRCFAASNHRAQQ